MFPISLLPAGRRSRRSPLIRQKSFALRGYRQQATGKKSAERSEQIEFMQSFMHSSNSQQSKSTCDKLDCWSFSTDACSASWSLRSHQKDEEQRDLQSGEKWKYYSWSIMVQYDPYLHSGFSGFPF
jgi:hypothetical protein